MVAFQDDGARLVGAPAKRQAVTNPTRTIASIKRFMGRRHHEVDSEEKGVAYTLTGGAQDLVKVQVGDKQYSPPEISAMVLGYLKEAAEAYLGETKQAKATIDRATGDLKGLERADARFQRALISQLTGAYDPALADYRAALPAFRRAGRRDWVADLLTNRGILHAYRGFSGGSGLLGHSWRSDLSIHQPNGISASTL